MQHRKIITYKKGSPSDFSTLRNKIEERLHAIAESSEKLEAIINEQVMDEKDKLTQMEFSALCIAFENIDSNIDGVSAYNIANDMERIGYNKLATKVALTALHRKWMIERSTKSDFDGNNFYAYDATAMGEAYILDNVSQIQLWSESTKRRSPIIRDDLLDDDIPF